MYFLGAFIQCMDPQEAVIFLLSKVRRNIISLFKGFTLHKLSDAKLYESRTFQAWLLCFAAWDYP